MVKLSFVIVAGVQGGTIAGLRHLENPDIAVSDRYRNGNWQGSRTYSTRTVALPIVTRGLTGH